jgi:hypothetical protein
MSVHQQVVANGDACVQHAASQRVGGECCVAVRSPVTSLAWRKINHTCVVRPSVHRGSSRFFDVRCVLGFTRLLISFSQSSVHDRQLRTLFLIDTRVPFLPVLACWSDHPIDFQPIPRTQNYLGVHSDRVFHSMASGGAGGYLGSAVLMAAEEHCNEEECVDLELSSMTRRRRWLITRGGCIEKAVRKERDFGRWTPTRPSLIVSSTPIPSSTSYICTAIDSSSPTSALSTSTTTRSV